MDLWRAIWANWVWGDPRQQQLLLDRFSDHCSAVVREVFTDVALGVGMNFEDEWRAWADHAVEHTAREIYQRRQFSRLPELGQLLKRAGCSEELILGHCDSAGPHFRGCWVLDLILGHDSALK